VLAGFYENLYAMPACGLRACIDVAQAVALAMKVRYGGSSRATS
jgi:hypothetical protein